MGNPKMRSVLSGGLRGHVDLFPDVIKFFDELPASGHHTKGHDLSSNRTNKSNDAQVRVSIDLDVSVSVAGRCSSSLLVGVHTGLCSHCRPGWYDSVCALGLTPSSPRVPMYCGGVWCPCADRGGTRARAFS